MEETVLLPEWLVAVFRGPGLLCLEGHVRIRDLGYVRDEENEGKDEDEDRDGEVDPLHILQRLCVVEVKKDIRPQDGSHDRADAIEGLGEVDSDLGILGRATNCNEIGSALGPLLLATGGGCQGQDGTYR